MTNISQSFTHKMAAKLTGIDMARLLRHCRPMYSKKTLACRIFCASLACGCGSVFLCRVASWLSIDTSGFLDGAMFADNLPGRGGASVAIE